MAIRKPTAQKEKSAVFAEFLSNEAPVQRFRSGSIIEGVVSVVKGNDVFVDIGYKSEGIVPLEEFGDDKSAAAGLYGFSRVVHYGGGVASHLVSHHAYVQLLSVRHKLVHGRRAESVACGKDDVLNA